jgi:hypothetical protein
MASLHDPPALQASRISAERLGMSASMAVAGLVLLFVALIVGASTVFQWGLRRVVVRHRGSG